jgi:hypothetical protein
MLGDGLGEVLGSAAARGDEGHVDIPEIIVVLQEFHGILFALEGIFLARAALGAKQYQVIHGEFSLREDAQELLPYRATGANNRYSHLSENYYFVNDISAKIQLFTLIPPISRYFFASLHHNSYTYQK